MMRVHARRFILVTLAVALAACASPNATTPPANTTLHQSATPIAPGTSFTFKRTTAESESTYIHRYEEIVPHQGRSAYRVTREDETLYYDADTYNWMTTASAGGAPLRSAAPYREVLRWPLWVGKSYRTRYNYTDHTRDRTWSGTAPLWTVEAEETITVPAGTFKALRLQSGPGKNVGFKETRWYAPELGVYVRIDYVRLSHHTLGPGGERRTELVGVNRPDDS